MGVTVDEQRSEWDAGRRWSEEDTLLMALRCSAARERRGAAARESAAVSSAVRFRRNLAGVPAKSCSLTSLRARRSSYRAEI